MGERNSPSVAQVGYDISPLSRVKLKLLTNQRNRNRNRNTLLNQLRTPAGLLFDTMITMIRIHTTN
jgi:hypothetical protein